MGWLDVITDEIDIKLQEMVKDREAWHAAVHQFSSVQFISVAQSCPTLCGSMNHSTPGLSVHLKLPEFTQIHVH